MKVTYVQPYYENIWEALGLGYIISYCLDQCPELEIDFFQGKFDSNQEIIKGCVESDIVAFSCTSPAFQPAVKLALAIKKENPKVRTVFGGWHTTALKDRCLMDGVDQVVVGEGEIAMMEIINGNESPVVVGTRPQWDMLPPPNREIIKNERTIELCESMNGKRTASFQANRVCPMQCVFCSERVMTGKFNRVRNPIRSRKAEDVCDEIEKAVEKYKLDYFKFVDGTFDVSPAYAIDFCKEKIRRGIETEWEALIHASFANEEMMEWLSKSNCNQINIGCESGSNKILKDIGKGLQIDKIKKVFSWAKRHNVKRRAFFILGMPNETKEDVALTEALIDEIKPDVVGFTILCPYPGSKLYDPDKHVDVDWETTDEYANDFWHTEHFSNAKLKELQAHLTTKYNNLLCERQQ